SAWPACRPSEPSSATGPPTSGTSAARKSGGVTGPRGGARGSRRSVSRDRVAQAGEQATPTGGVLADHLDLVAVEFAHLLHKLAALAVQPLGDHDLHVDGEIARAAPADAGHAAAAQRDGVAGLRTGGDVDLEVLAHDRLHAHAAAEHRVHDRDADGAVQVLPVAHEHRVGTLVDLDVEVARGSTAGADLALAGQADTHAVADAGRDACRDGAALTHPPLPGAAAAGVGDDLAGPRTGGARAAGHDVAQQGPLDGLDLPLPLAHPTGGRRGVSRRSLPVAGLTQDRRVDLDLLGDPGGALLEIERHADECVGARLDATAGPAGSAARTATEERFEDVAQAPATEAATSGEASPVTAAGGVVERVAAHVDDPALLGIGQHLVHRGDLGELLTCLVRRVDIGVQLAGELPVRPLDLGLRGSPIDPEGPVVVA